MSANKSELKSRKRVDYPFIRDYRTRWNDNDVFQHMNNAVYVFLYDSVLSTYLTEKCNLQLSTSPQIAVVVHSHSDYFAQIAFPAVAEVGLRANKIGRSSVVWEMGLFERGLEEVRAVGEFVQVWVDKETRKPLKEGLTGDIRKAIDALYMGPNLEKKKSKL
ncbi:hypothetical protein BROUX41_002227 [Berkeleyomyces rouxiae]|uniref:uncharacterized protein n=1 Tax=Berkeleyomyces rouxiae TaxID=2035830 RepID=UPI003B7DB210